MFVRRTVSTLAVVLLALAIPSGNDLVRAVGQTVVSICHDGLWDPGEYCGRDAWTTTGVADMNHDCFVDGLDIGLFGTQYTSVGANLSADINNSGHVNLQDFALLGTGIGDFAAPCTSVPIPTVCDGTIALSFSSNPATIVSSASQAAGAYTAYVVIDNVTNARIVEYSIQTSPNVVITNQVGVGNLFAPVCGDVNSLAMVTTAVIASGPAVIAQINYQLTNGSPATLSIGQGSCDYSRVRWAPADGSVDHRFTSMLHAGINGPTPSPTSSVCIATGKITGRVYADLGNDCGFSLGTDFPIGGRLIEITPGPYTAITDETGNYEISVPAGSYTVTQTTIAGDPWALQSCQTSASYAVNVVAGGSVPGNDFALYAPGGASCDVSVHIASFPTGGSICGRPIAGVCRGIEHGYAFVVRSNATSTTPIDAGSLIDITLAPTFTISAVTSDFPVSVVSSPGPNQRTVQLDDDVNPGQTVVVTVTATPAAGGPYATQMVFDDSGACGGVKTASLSETESCSCDPNDKIVVPAGCGPDGQIVGDIPMTYTIHFENIGPGDAHDVFIEDALDTDLALSSLAVVAASHTVTGVQVNPGNVLVVSFDGIELPGNGDPNNNDGFVVLMIDPKPNLTDGTTIQNTAEIFFDDNEPVVTNTTLNTIRAVPSPVAAFTYQDACDGDFTSVDFTYSGSTPDNATFLWNFGPGATPATSTAQDPADVLFTSGGSKNVTLTVTRFGCQSVASQAIVIEQCAPICHDGVWEDGEFCGYDAYVTTGVPDMNHDCRVDGLDMGLFGFQFGSVGAGLSGDLNNSGDVGVTDFSLLLSQYGQVITTGCTSAAPLDTCAGSVALSFTDDPFAIDDNEVQATGPNTAYVVVDGADGARIVEYSIVASPNVVITSHTLLVGGNSWRNCGSGSLSARVFSLTDALPSGPLTVAEIQYTLTNSNPATLTIAASSCSTRNRWATVAGDRSHDFDEISNAGINGPTPPPSSSTCTSTGIEPVVLPNADQLGQNHPNPFNPTTTIEYGLASQKRVTISIYSVRGELVRMLVDDTLPAGWHRAEWNGRDESGNTVASGIYLYRMQAGSFAETKKLVLLK